jgi:hypothetical protein
LESTDQPLDLLKMGLEQKVRARIEEFQKMASEVQQLILKFPAEVIPRLNCGFHRRAPAEFLPAAG